jgi:hypothetical protein
MSIRRSDLGDRATSAHRRRSNNPPILILMSPAGGPKHGHALLRDIAEGNYDRVLDFSRAVTGTLFFVPTADFLDDPPPLPTTSAR